MVLSVPYGIVGFRTGDWYGYIVGSNQVISQLMARVRSIGIASPISGTGKNDGAYPDDAC